MADNVSVSPMDALREKRDSFVWPDVDCDWRGTPITPGCIVTYHVQTRGGKTVEAEVVQVTDGDIYRGKTVMVRPLRESCIGVARPPTSYTREDKKLFAVPQLNVTVLKGKD